MPRDYEFERQCVIWAVFQKYNVPRDIRKLIFCELHPLDKNYLKLLRFARKKMESRKNKDVKKLEPNWFRRQCAIWSIYEKHKVPRDIRKYIHSLAYPKEKNKQLYQWELLERTSKLLELYPMARQVEGAHDKKAKYERDKDGYWIYKKSSVSMQIQRGSVFDTSTFVAYFNFYTAHMAAKTINKERKKLLVDVFNGKYGTLLEVFERQQITNNEDFDFWTLHRRLMNLIPEMKKRKQKLRKEQEERRKREKEELEKFHSMYDTTTYWGNPKF